MRKALMLFAATLFAVGSAHAQEVSGGAGRIEVGAFPGGGMFFTQSSNGNEPAFGNYALGASFTVNVNRWFGVEGDGGGTIGVHQAFNFGPTAFTDQRTPSMWSYNGNVVFNDESVFSVDLNGPNPGASYDQLRVNGTVDLGAANQVYSEIRALKVDLTFAVGGIKNHEIYFEHLGGAGGDPDGAIGALIERDFGSADAWRADLRATGMAGRGWAWTAFDWDEGKLFNYIGDAQNTFPVWNATPLVALDVYEHAYFLDYQTDRAAYIEAFLRNLDWGVVNGWVESYRVPIG